LMSKKKMLEGFLGGWFREKITRNPKFLLVGISLGSSTWSKENKLVEMIWEGSSWCSSFQHGAEFICWMETKFVRGRISCTGKKD
jgi:hypothetical protein